MISAGLTFTYWMQFASLMIAAFGAVAILWNIMYQLGKIAASIDNTVKRLDKIEPTVGRIETDVAVLKHEVAILNHRVSRVEKKVDKLAHKTKKYRN